MTIIPPKITGLKRVLRAAEFSWDGLKAVYKTEESFRHDVLLCVILIPLSFFVKATRAEHILLIMTTLAVPVAELINTAIEVVIERISPDWHAMSKKAKDIGSAIVFMALVQMIVVWAWIFFF